MAALKLYRVKINGIDHLMQLNPEDAKTYGDRAKPYIGKTPGAKAPQDGDADAVNDDKK